MSQISIIICLIGISSRIAFTLGSSAYTQSFDDGGVYKIFSSTDGNALSVSTQNSVQEGTAITALPYTHLDNQKWVALRQSSSIFVLIPKKQHWDWSQTKLTNGITSLPDFTMALGVDPSGNILQQLIDGTKPHDYQKWKVVPAGEKHVLMKNYDKDLCLKNPGQTASPQQSVYTQGLHKLDNIFGGGHHHEHRNTGAIALLLTDCDSTDETQKWKLESANLD